MKNPQFQSYTVNIGHKKINTDVLNEELLEIKLPYGVSEFSINGINKHQITNIFLNGNEITSPDEISSNLLKLKIKMLFKVFGLSFAGLLLEIILAALFFIPQKDKFWENLKNNKSVFYISCLILAVFILWNFYNVFQNAVDLPFGMSGKRCCRDTLINRLIIIGFCHFIMNIKFFGHVCFRGFCIILTVGI